LVAQGWKVGKKSLSGKNARCKQFFSFSFKARTDILAKHIDGYRYFFPRLMRAFCASSFMPGQKKIIIKKK